MHDRSMTKQRHTFDFIGQLQIFWSQRGTKAPTDWEDSINPTKTLSLIRQTSIGHKIHSQTPQALATGARLAAHRQSTRDHYGESSHDKPVAHMYCMWLHKQGSSSMPYRGLLEVCSVHWRPSQQPVM